MRDKAHLTTEKKNNLREILTDGCVDGFVLCGAGVGDPGKQQGHQHPEPKHPVLELIIAWNKQFRK